MLWIDALSLPVDSEVDVEVGQLEHGVLLVLGAHLVLAWAQPDRVDAGLLLAENKNRE